MIEAAEQMPQSAAARRFAELLVAGDFDGAFEMLSPDLAQSTTAEDLARDYSRMTEYGDGLADSVQPVTTLEDWPGRQPGDLGWAYVSIEGPQLMEGIAVVVTTDEKVREIEWGRP